MNYLSEIKSNIDWKFVNYLTDKLTYYEDKGYITTLCLNIQTGYSCYDYKSFITLRNGNIEYELTKIEDNDYYAYKRNGIYYSI